MAKADDLKAMIAEAESIVVFTGAGISTESGIPGLPQPGRRLEPDEADRLPGLRAVRRGRREAWRRTFTAATGWSGATQRRPPRRRAAGRAGQGVGRDHAERRQSAPGLRRARRQGDRAARQRQLRHVPRLRPAPRAGWAASRVFRRPASCPPAGLRRHRQDGDHLVRPVDAARPRWRGRSEATLACDLFIVLGSSLVVYPAAGFPVVAKRNGARSSSSTASRPTWTAGRSGAQRRDRRDHEPRGRGELTRR